MHINIVTLFPEFFEGPLTCALMQRARDAGLISFSLHNPRDMAEDRHHTVDDRPYGGGPGMVMLPGPVAKTLRALGHRPRGEPQPGRLLFLSPKGAVFSQALARELATGAPQDFFGVLPDQEVSGLPAGHAAGTERRLLPR